VGGQASLDAKVVEITVNHGWPASDVGGSAAPSQEMPSPMDGRDTIRGLFVPEVA
jgi:hypothetical protein